MICFPFPTPLFRNVTPDSAISLGMILKPPDASITPLPKRNQSGGSVKLFIFFFSFPSILPIPQNSASKVLKEIIEKKKAASNKKEPDPLTDQKTKPDKPLSKKPGIKKTSAKKNTKKSGSGRKPAKKGSSSSRKKK